MKTAISVPDEIFQRAEAAAKKLRISRSKLYTTAVAEYLDRKRSKSITKHLNEVYSRNNSTLDPALERMMLETWRKQGQ
jgi:antitoxin MazE6